MSSCPKPKCKSWEEANPYNWVIVATVSGVVTAILTALFAKWLGITNLQRQRQLQALQQQTRTKYRMVP